MCEMNCSLHVFSDPVSSRWGNRFWKWILYFGMVRNAIKRWDRWLSAANIVCHGAAGAGGSPSQRLGTAGAPWCCQERA